MRYGIFLLAILLMIACQARAADPEDEAMNAIEPSRLEAHVRFLADDLLEGRGTATRGYDVAALYVAAEFQRLGLQSGATDSSYLQRVPLRKAMLVPEQCRLTANAKGTTLSFKYGEDYVMTETYTSQQSEVDTELVFAGYGIIAPDRKYNSYEGLNVQGKIVVIISGAPESFPPSERAHFSSTTTKQRTAADQGAVGILTIRSPTDEKRVSWERVVRGNQFSGFRWTDSKGEPQDVVPELKATATLNRNAAARLMKAAGRNLDEIFNALSAEQIKTGVLPVRVSLKKVSKFEPAVSWNVVAMLSGSDPRLSQEHVVITAHLDHLGVSAPINGDSINNGAYDNSTGIAALIEIARAFASMKEKPKRSISFVAVTAEEKGLEGSEFFANHPSIPIESVVANVNIDMFLMLFPVSEVLVLGAEHSTLGPIAEKAANKAGLKLVPDPAPEEVRFVRSDQYSFIKKGIPSAKLVTGFGSSDPKVNGADVTRQWLRTIYHTPADEVGQPMHWESGKKIVQTTFLIAYYAAVGERPRWNENDFFGRLYSRAPVSGRP